mgnify:CR=1 FL=1
MIKVVKGNLLYAPVDVIGHQVNCKGVMGAGIAKQLRNKYSELFSEYKEYLVTHPRPLGDLLMHHQYGLPLVANLFGQDGYGRGRRYTDYHALESALGELYDLAYLNGWTVALPYGIGCGLAGGDWDTVYKIIESIFTEVDCYLYKL